MRLLACPPLLHPKPKGLGFVAEDLIKARLHYLCDNRIRLQS